MNTVVKLKEDRGKVLKFSISRKAKYKKPVKRVNGTVHPIKNKEDIERAKQYYLNQQDYFKNGTNLRNYCLFVFSLNCARRISDTLKLKVGDIVNEKGIIKDNLIIKEKKTKKNSEIFLNQNVKEAIAMYLDTRKDLTLNQVLFLSREGNNQPIKRRQAFNIFRKMADEIGLTERGIKIGTHSPRKSFVYHNLKDHPNTPLYIATIQDALKHASPQETLRYAGISREELMDLYLNNPL